MVVFLKELEKNALSTYALHEEHGILCLVAIFSFFLNKTILIIERCCQDLVKNYIIINKIMTSVVIIPARYDSTRFPGKPLSLLKGKTLIQHVYENSRGAHFIDDVIVATDSEAILEKVLSFGGKAVMTSRSHPSG